MKRKYITLAQAAAVVTLEKWGERHGDEVAPLSRSYLNQRCGMLVRTSLRRVCYSVSMGVGANFCLFHYGIGLGILSGVTS